MKKLYTKEEFSRHLQHSASKMAMNEALQTKALDVLVEADKHDWVHQTSWFGEPVLNLPQDMFALQEIIFRTRPKYIIEVGVAWGGSLLFYSTLMEVLVGGEIIGIDIYMPDDLKERLLSFGKLSERLHLVEGSSVSDGTVSRVLELTEDSTNCLVVLDSHHTHEHVLEELRLYERFVQKGNYMICGDTIVEHLPTQFHRERPWGPGDNPMTALNTFLEENNRFETDELIENKLLLSCNPRGYLRANADVQT